MRLVGLVAGLVRLVGLVVGLVRLVGLEWLVAS